MNKPFWADKTGRFTAYEEQNMFGWPTGKYTIGLEASKAFIEVATGLDEDDADELVRRLNIYQEAAGMLKAIPPRV